MSTFFTGLTEQFLPSNTNPIDNLQQLKVFPGQVLEICMDSNSPLYETNRDIGKIRFRDLAKEYNKPEINSVKVAYPLDRSIARYPYPGEEVIIYRAYGESRSTAAMVISNIFFYSFVVSTHHNVSYNQNPFTGTDVFHINPNNPFISYDTAKKRFEKKTKDVNNVRDGANKTKVYKQLRPQEGDFILQGRFGNTIRFGSTSPKAKDNTEWNKEGSTGVSGDGIMVFRVDRDNTTDEKSMLTSEDINRDDATMYMCTSQKIELQLACPKNMKTWATRFDLPDPGSKEAEGIVSTSTDTSELWQKVIDGDKPVEQTFNKLDTGNGEDLPDLPNNQQPPPPTTQEQSTEQ